MKDMKNIKKLTVLMIAVSLIGQIAVLAACSSGRGDVVSDGYYDYPYDDYEEDIEKIVWNEGMVGELVPLRNGRLAGALNSEGIQVIPYEFNRIEYTGNDRYLLYNENKASGSADIAKEGKIVDSKNNEIIPEGSFWYYPNTEYGSYGYSGGKADEGLMAASETKGGKVGFISTTDGSWVIKPQYRSACNFKNGLAIVKDENGMFGLIDIDGNYVVEPKYKKLVPIRSEHTGEPAMCAEDEDGETVFVFANGDEVRPGRKILDEELDFIGDLAIVTTGSEGDHDLYNVVDREGRLLLEKDRSGVYIGNGMFEACRESNDDPAIWELYDNTGKKITDEKCSAEPFCTIGGKGAAIVIENSSNKCGLIGADGKYIIPPEYDEMTAHTIYDTSDGSVPAATAYQQTLLSMRRSDNDKISLMNADGETVANEEYDEFGYFKAESGLAYVIKDGKICFVNIDGELVKQTDFGFGYGTVIEDDQEGEDPVNYGEPEFLDEDHGVIPDVKTGLYALIDKDCNLLTNYIYDNPHHDSEGDSLIVAERDDPEGEGAVTVWIKDGKETAMLGMNAYSDYAIVNGGEFACVSVDHDGSNCALMNSDGKILTEYKYSK